MKCGFKEWTEGWVGEVWARGEGKGGVRVYEAYEVKKWGGNYAVYYFAGKICFFFIFIKVFTWEIF